MGRQSNLLNQNRHQYDFLNPDGRKNLHLNKKHEWEEKSNVDYKADNKEIVKNIEEDVRSIQMEIKQQLEEKKNGKFKHILILIFNFFIETPFKMEKFKNIEPKIKN